MDTATYRIDGHTMREHWFHAPIDYFGAFADDKGTHTIFAREYIRDGHEDAPRLVFFQGGPGHSGPRFAPISSWLDIALDHYRVVLLDQRGTGNSSPLGKEVIATMSSPKAQAAYLSCFRQDSIVRDAELLRRHLQGDEPWAALGQSFGGFCVTNYLSQAPEGLTEAFITAGLPSLNKHVDEVYMRTYPVTAARSRALFERYPKDEETAWYVATHLADVEELLDDGTRLTPARFRQLGQILVFSYGLDDLHFMLADPVWNLGGSRRLRPEFMREASRRLSFASNPLYGALQEAIYGQRSTGATGWSAERVRARFDEFRLPPLAAGGTGEVDLRKEGHGFRFYGEHIFRSHFHDDPELIPFKPAVDILAQKTDWHELYSPPALAENQVPVAAWIYEQDMCVPFELSMETANAIRGLVPLVSDTYHHDALRTGGRSMLEKLFAATK